jgi:hypothetical protein
MSGDVNSPSTRPHRFLVAFGYLGGGIAWLLHLLSAYAIAEFGCVAGAGAHRWAGVTLVAWLLLGVTAVLLLAGVASMLVAVKLRAREPGGELESSLSARAYLARSGAIMSGLFVLIILAQTVPIFYYLESC